MSNHTNHFFFYQELLGVDSEKLKGVLTFTSNYAKGSIIRRNYTKQQAQSKLSML